MYKRQPLRILVDCGKFQGEAEKEKNRFFGFEPDKIDVVFVTHAHYDLSLIHIFV